MWFEQLSKEEIYDSKNCYVTENFVNCATCDHTTFNRMCTITATIKYNFN